MILAGLASLALLSCNKQEPSVTPTPDPDPKPDVPTPDPQPVPKDTVLIVVGQEQSVGSADYYDAVVWIDGKRLALTSGDHDAFCNAVKAVEDTIYIVGCEAIGELIDDGYYDPYNANNGVLWKFVLGKENEIERSVYGDVKGNSSVVGVSVSGKNVYACGFDSPGYDRRALYWKNSEKIELTDGTTDALAYCIASEGDDVYVGGYVQSATVGADGYATIWKNGEPQYLTTDGSLAKVNRIVVKNGHVYAAGAYKVNGEKWRGAIWIDGVQTLFTEAVGTAVGGLYVDDEGRWIVNGNMSKDNGNIVACNWYSDGTVEEISSDMALCEGVGIAVCGEHRYTIGNMTDFDYNTFEDISKAYLWDGSEMVDGMEITTPDNFAYWDLTVALF